MNIWFASIVVFGITVAQNVTHNGGKSYFFKMGKNSNEFRVNNRIMYLNHNITDLELPIVNNKRMYQQTQTVEKLPKQDFSLYLDEEWNYDHNKNFNKSHLPMFVRKFYDESVASPESTITTRILFNTNKNESSPILKFKLDSLNAEDTILDAELYFYWALKNNSQIFRESAVLRLYQFEKHHDFNQTNFVQNPDMHKLFNVIYVSKAHKGWQMFKVKKTIDNWLHGEENLGMILTISSYETNELLEVFNDTHTGNFSTFILVTSQYNDSQSENNEIATLEREDPFSQCQRQSWTINFNQMGWDKFIIQPAEFTAYDCVGKCSKAIEKDTNHAKFLYMFQKRIACCVPTRFLPLTVMFFDKHGDIAIKNYDKTIVTVCECR